MCPVPHCVPGPELCLGMSGSQNESLGSQALTGKVSLDLLKVEGVCSRGGFTELLESRTLCK